MKRRRHKKESKRGFLQKRERPSRLGAGYAASSTGSRACAERNNICQLESGVCTRQSSYGVEGGKPVLCTLHKEAGRRGRIRCCRCRSRRQRTSRCESYILPVVKVATPKRQGRDKSVKHFVVGLSHLDWTTVRAYAGANPVNPPRWQLQSSAVGGSLRTTPHQDRDSATPRTCDVCTGMSTTLVC